MPRFSANLAYLFNETPFPARFEKAASAGFKAVEYPYPEGYSKEQLVELLAKYHLEQVLFNFPKGRNGELGMACVPERVAEFQDGVGRAIPLARALKCTRINCLVGNAPPGVSADRMRQTLVDNLRFAAVALEKEGIRLMVEALNSMDAPGFYLLRSADTLALIKEVNRPNVYFQYDIYQMQMSEGNLTRTILDNLPRIGHMQLGDVPGRHEPGTGEINYPNLLRAIDEADYDGWIGCEYKPVTSTEAGLGWMKPYMAKGVK